MEVIAQRAYFRARAAGVKYGTENERSIMTNVTVKPLNPGRPQRNTRHIAPANRAWMKSVRPLPAISLHVPVTPQNRSRLRALRQAEMAAWNATADTGFDTAHTVRKQAAVKERRDLLAFGLIALMAVTTVAISLVKSSVLTEGWAGLVHFVHQLLG